MNHLLPSILLDARLALRRLFGQPIVGFTIIGSLALAIGGTLAIFAFVMKLLVAPLPVEDPHRLRVLGYTEGGPSVSSTFSMAFAEAVEEQLACFDGVLARGQRDVDLELNGVTLGVTVEFVSSDYFRVLGLKPAAGRFLDRSDGANSSVLPAAVISHRTWVETFDKRRDIVGSIFSLEQARVQIVGVAPDRFNGTSAGELHAFFLPLQAAAHFGPLDRDRNIWLHIFGRSKQSMTSSATSSCVEIAMPQIAEGLIHRGSKDRKFIASEGARGIERLRGKLEQPGLLLIIATGLVFSLVCLNLATLLATVSHARSAEVAIRVSLGASPFRLVRQLFVECASYCLIGGVAGLLVGYWLLRLLLAFLVDNRVSVAVDVPFDLTLLVIASFLAFLASVFLTLVPTFLVSRAAPIHQAASLGQGQQTRRFSNLRSGMMIAQVALSMLLLTTGIFLLQSARNLRSASVGFQLAGLGTMSVALPKTNQDGAARELTANNLFESLSDIAGVESVAISTQGLLSNYYSMIGASVEGSQTEGVLLHRIGPQYFKTLRTRILNGREFSRTDNEAALQVAIVNHAFQRRFFKGENPVGRIVYANGPKFVVAVVDNVAFTSVRENDPPILYLPLAQSPRFWETNQPIELQIRSAQPEATLQAAFKVSRRIKQLEPFATVKGVSSLEERRDILIVVERTVASVTTLFAAFACIVALLGLGSLVGYNVVLRRHEIAIRMSMGANSRSIAWLFLRGIFSIVLVGVVIGYAACISGWSMIRAYTFDVSPSDLRIPAVIAFGLVACALLATSIPVRKAVRVSPMDTLRQS